MRGDQAVRLAQVGLDGQVVQPRPDRLLVRQGDAVAGVVGVGELGRRALKRAAIARRLVGEDADGVEERHQLVARRRRGSDGLLEPRLDPL